MSIQYSMLKLAIRRRLRRLHGGEGPLTQLRGISGSELFGIPVIRNNQTSRLSLQIRKIRSV